MQNYPLNDRSYYVNQTFSRIARQYDLMNNLMTAGMDTQWRKKVIRLARLSPNSILLDLGTGTGDLARAALHHTPSARITAADFTLEMMTTGNNWRGIHRCAADALGLPFESESYDRVISGFLMRNVASVERCLKEQYRVLKPNGIVVILDTTKPRKNPLSPLINFYLGKVIPFLGSVITGDKEAYIYLPESTQNFLRAEELATQMSLAGFVNVTFKIRMFGTVAIHTAIKPETLI